MLLDLLFPRRCVWCGSFGDYLCAQCIQLVKPFTFGVCPVCDRPSHHGETHEVCRSPTCLDGFLPLVEYNAPIQEVVRILKYDGVSDAARTAYHITKLHWPVFAPTLDLLVPIPLHPKRQRERGYNQAECIARSIATVRKLPCETHALIKVRHTEKQAGKDKTDRTQLQQPFVCLHPAQIQDKVVGLVDDVATTRTTLSLACEVLKKAGAKQVWGVVLAHPY